MNFLKSLFGPPSPDRFAGIVIKEIQRAGGPADIRYDREMFHLSMPDGSMVSLSNLYSEYVASSRANRHKLLQTIVALAAELGRPEQSLDEVKAKLLPRVRERFYWEMLRFQVEMQGSEHPMHDLAPHQEINEHLTVELVVDGEQTIRSIAPDHLKRWGISFEQGMAIAKDNLWNRSNEPFRKLRDGLYVSPWMDTHDASRLYLYDLIWQLKVKGDHVAAVPNRNVLIVTGSEDTEGLLAMAAVIEETLTLPRPMLAMPMRLADRSWTPLEVPKSHPAYGALRRLELMNQADYYENQRQCLHALHAKNGEDIFVASYMTLEKQDPGECLSCCVWSEGVDSLLPRTHEVMFMSDPTGRGKPEPVGRFEWEHVEAVVGNLMEPQVSYPQRYRVRQFPTAEQFAEMTARAGSNGL